jgi:hypothetical protein
MNGFATRSTGLGKTGLSFKSSGFLFTVQTAPVFLFLAKCGPPHLKQPSRRMSSRVVACGRPTVILKKRDKVQGFLCIETNGPPHRPHGTGG